MVHEAVANTCGPPTLYSNDLSEESHLCTVLFRDGVALYPTMASGATPPCFLLPRHAGTLKCAPTLLIANLPLDQEGILRELISRWD